MEISVVTSQKAEIYYMTQLFFTHSTLPTWVAVFNASLFAIAGNRNNLKVLSR